MSDGAGYFRSVTAWREEQSDDHVDPWTYPDDVVRPVFDPTDHDA
jgi:hypothetical protein